MTQTSTTNTPRRAASSTPKESSVEDYLVERVKRLGGISLKGAVPGQRFIDRICIMHDGVTLWIECKRPKGGRRTRLQEHRIEELLERGHFAFFVKSREEVDLVLGSIRVFYGGKLRICGAELWTSTPKGLVR